MSSSSETPILRFESVDKSFGDTPVLSDLSFDVERGEHIGLIGPSGSGKSTILRILMTLEDIDRGRVLVSEEELWSPEVLALSKRARERHLRALRSRIGMVFQHFYLFPHMTALENVSAAQVWVQGQDRREADRKSRELLAEVGLEDRAEARPAQLSGGQKQRVAIARALAVDPEILLFDEVTSALDPEMVGEVLRVLRDIARDSDRTVLIVSHQMDFIAEICQRVLFLDGGRIVEQGPPDRLFGSPEQERTRQFLDALLGAPG
jgi:polar amino acid transport system ATP-binding protein